MNSYTKAYPPTKGKIPNKMANNRINRKAKQIKIQLNARSCR
jgi:hypothetical protein